jgi:arsenite oxidase small subunit
MPVNRRSFLKICSATVALSAVRAGRLLAAGSAARAYPRARLVGGDGRPVRAGELQPGVNYLFHYPFVGTPALLVRLPVSSARRVSLKTADGRDYVWEGGCGLDGTVVAFSAICQHQLSAALARQSFISFRSTGSEVAERANTIVCCAHHSVYDPLSGGSVMSGPAPQPLTAIALEHDAAGDGIEATGTVGNELFEEFFGAYRRELIEEFGRGKARQTVAGTARLWRMDEYVAQIVVC